ncbi:aldo/keto reductase [Shigella boydii]|nr:allantoinase domain protein [Shigella flexneri 1485-80]PHU93980.1 aldo/keto reductase [Shigella boydii]
MPCFTAMRAEIALMSGSAFAVTHHAFSSGAGRTSDGNGSHASTLKSPSYTKSISWQHYPISQVILRWNIQRGVVVIPKSTHQQRIEENFAIWDFSLTEKEMAQISSLDLGYVGESVKHFNPEFVRGCLAVKIHD